jgi:hypothetical protein
LPPAAARNEKRVRLPSTWLAVAPARSSVSFGGHLAKGQIKCLRDLYDGLSADRDMELVIGVDYDEKGHFYAGMLLREFPRADRIFPNGKDFNDDLMKLREGARRIR